MGIFENEKMELFGLDEGFTWGFTGPRNGNAQEWHPFIFPFLDNHSKRGTHSKYRFQSLKRYRFHSNGTFKRGLPRGMENGEEHSNAFECIRMLENIRMLEKSPVGGGGGC